MAEATTTPVRRKGSCLGRLFKVTAVLVILLVALVALAPTLASTGPGTRFVEGMVAPNIDGTFSVGKLGLSWFGGQSASNVKIVDRAGKPAMDLEVDVSNGLLDLARGGWKTVNASVGGTVNVTRRADGSYNLAELMKQPPAGAAPATTAPSTPPGAAAQGPVVPAGLDATVRIDGLDVHVVDEQTGKTVDIKKLSGTAIAGTVRPISIKLKGFAEYEGKPGEFGLAADLTDLVQPDGSLRFKGAKASASANVQNVAVPLPQMLVDVKRLTANVESADLTESIKILADGDATLNGATPSTVHADVVANKLLSPSGVFTFKPEQIAADITATNLPTAIAQPFLKDQPIVVTRDIGPIAAATIQLPAGGGEMTFTMKADNLDVEGKGSVDNATGALTFTKLVAKTNVQPALLEAAAGLSSTKPILVRADFDRVFVPGADPKGDRDLGAVVLTGTVALPGAIELSRLVELPVEGGPRTEPLGVGSDLTIRLEANTLRDGLRVVGGGTIEGGTLAIDEKLTNLVDAKGAIDTKNIAAIGSVALTNIAPQRILGVLPEQQRVIAREVLTGPVDARLATSGTATALDGTLALTSGALKVDAKGAVRSNATGRSLSLQSATASVPATPALLAALQQGTEKPIALTQPATVSATLRPVEIDLAKLATIMSTGPTMVADLAMTPATLAQVPGVTGTVGINEFKGVATIKPGAELGVGFDGGAKIAASGQPLTSVALGADVRVPQGEGKDSATSIRATVDAKEIQVAAVETMLGKKPGDLASLLGSTGSLVVEALPQPGGITDVHLVPVFQTAKGDIQAKLTPTAVQVPTGRIDFALTVDQLNRYFAPATPQGQQAPALVFAAPINVQLALEGASVDQKTLAGEPGDPAATRGTLKASTSPVAMKIASGQTISFQGFSANATCERLDKGLSLTVDGKGAADAASASLAIRGTVRNLLDATSRLKTDGATIDGQATAVQVPTALLDRFQNLDGLLVTALGELLDGNVTVTALSRTAGTMSARLSSANGKIDAPQLSLRDGMLLVESAKPITGELQLTKPLRDRLLRDINPILADIRQTEQPLRLSIPNFAYPLDGDHRRLNGDIQLTVGAVQFDTGSQLLSFLEVFNKKQAPTIPGMVDPLAVAIRAGQLAYQDFALHVGKYEGGWKHTLKFSGDVDLTQNPPYARAIKSMYPIDGLAKSIEELQKIPLLGLVAVGITFYGPLYDPQGQAKTLQYKIDVSVDLPKKPEEILSNPAVKDAIGNLLDKIKKK